MQLEVQKKGHGHRREVVEAVVETFQALTETERRVRSDVSELHQEEVKKPGSERVRWTETAELVPIVSVDNSGLASWEVEVNVCKDDREVEIAKFDGDTIRKECEHR